MLIVKIEASENGSHKNQTATFCPEGYAILPEYLVPEHFPFFTIDSIEEGIITAVTDGIFPGVPAEERRRRAYETEQIISYGDTMLTVDAAREICSEYMCEDTDRARQIVSELTEKITVAKAAIREREGEE